MVELNYLSHLPLRALNLLNNQLNEAEYREFLQAKFPGIEIDRVDYELYRRAE